MNAVEIEEAISALAEQPFNAEEFPFAFLEAFGNKETTIKRLRSGGSNKSDLGGVLQTNNVHIAVSPPDEVTKALAALKASPATAKAKARFILATDGVDFEAEDLTGGETVACAYRDFPDHFGFFLPLAGITTVKQIRESSFDIRATSQTNAPKSLSRTFAALSCEISRPKSLASRSLLRSFSAMCSIGGRRKRSPSSYRSTRRTGLRAAMRFSSIGWPSVLPQGAG